MFQILGFIGITHRPQSSSSLGLPYYRVLNMNLKKELLRPMGRFESFRCWGLGWSRLGLGPSRWTCFGLSFCAHGTRGCGTFVQDGLLRPGDLPKPWNYVAEWFDLRVTTHILLMRSQGKSIKASKRPEDLSPIQLAVP